MNMYDEVLFSEIAGQDGDLGIITLNRPAALNSLNHTMIQVMHAQLHKWATATHIKAVVIRAAEGRAFCAGGDIRLAYERMRAGDIAATEFFRDEYELNKFIFHFPKPYIALLDGITMGGGVGISIHGSHRVATDRLLFAMPETGIGFFPDVGGTYFLPRLPGMTGFYLGLIGARISADDCIALGIAQQKVASDSLVDLIDALAAHSFSDDAYATVTHVIEQFRATTQPSALLDQQADIDACFSAAKIEEIVQLLQSATTPLCKEAAKLIHKKSPTSLKVTLAALQRGKQLDFDTCMQQEFCLTNHFVRGHDFPEGIDAVVIRKDHAPEWRPRTIEEVTAEDVEKYFISID